MNCPGAAARRSSIAGHALDQLGVLDHHHRVGAARHHAAGGDGGGGAGRHLELRRVAAGDHLGVERELLRRARRARRPCRRRAARSRRHWRGRTAARRSAPTTSCASTRPSAAASVTRLGGQRREIEMALEARARLLGGDDFEELLLPRGRADRGEQLALGARCAWRSALMATASPRRARRPDSLRCRPAPGSSRRRWVSACIGR